MTDHDVDRDTDTESVTSTETAYSMRGFLFPEELPEMSFGRNADSESGAEDAHHLQNNQRHSQPSVASGTYQERRCGSRSSRISSLAMLKDEHSCSEFDAAEYEHLYQAEEYEYENLSFFTSPDLRAAFTLYESNQSHQYDAAEERYKNFKELFKSEDGLNLRDELCAWLEDPTVTQEEKNGFFELSPAIQKEKLNAFWDDIAPDPLRRKELLTFLVQGIRNGDRVSREEKDGVLGMLLLCNGDGLMRSYSAH